MCPPPRGVGGFARRAHLLTTLLCILLSALLTRRLALLVCGAGFCCILAAAAMEKPEAPERSVRLKVEENVLAEVIHVLGGDCGFRRAAIWRSSLLLYL